jgi:hypothetical protein
MHCEPHGDSLSGKLRMCLSRAAVHGVCPLCAAERARPRARSAGGRPIGRPRSGPASWLMRHPTRVAGLPISSGAQDGAGVPDRRRADADGASRGDDAAKRERRREPKVGSARRAECMREEPAPGGDNGRSGWWRGCGVAAERAHRGRAFLVPQPRMRLPIASVLLRIGHRSYSLHASTGCQWCREPW